MPGSSPKQSRGSNGDNEQTEFTLHALKSSPGSPGQLTKVTFRCPNKETYQIWSQQIHHQMQSKLASLARPFSVQDYRWSKTCWIIFTCHRSGFQSLVATQGRVWGITLLGSVLLECHDFQILRTVFSDLQHDWSGTTIFKIQHSTIYSLPVISRTRTLVGLASFPGSPERGSLGTRLGCCFLHQYRWLHSGAQDTTG